MPVSTPNGYLDFTNATPRATKVIATSNVGIGTSAPGFSLDVHGDSNTGAVTSTTINVTDTTASTSKTSGSLTVAGGLGVSGNIYADLPVATIASNLVTYDKTTGLLKDSGGLFSNKLAVVSEQPPAALTSASTTITDHGVYKVTASVGSATAPNVFNKTGTSWTGSADYTGTNSVYAGSTRLASSIPQGDWIVLELPYKATLRHLTVTDGPLKANLFATNDNITWTELTNWSSTSGTFIVNATATYKKYAVVATQLSSGATLTFGELRLFTESFAIDGGKVAMASSAITGGNTVVDQTGPHARDVVPLRKYPEVALTTNIQGGYTVNVSSADTNSSRTLIGAFDGILDDSFGKGWQSKTRYSKTTGLPTTAPDNATFTVAGVDYTGQWVKLELPQKIRVESIVLSSCYNTTTTDDRRPENGVFLGSNDDTNWEVIKTFNNDLDYNDLDFGQDSVAARANSQATIRGITNTSYYKYLMIVITKIATTNQYGPVQINELEYHGTEETSDPDTSVDTKITSQFNLPDTTGVKLYIDGDKGSTATDFSGEGHTLTDNSESFSGNAWSFTSLSTSNVVSDDLGFEGDHPHAVSMWFNAANVSSNATLFHVGTAAGEGDAKTAISLTESGHLGWIDGGDNQFLSANTWHNLVYATQGGGGVRTCYLDGRKLADVSVQDTFGEYPPFAMTTYSEYGYTVSASSDIYSHTGFTAWKAFNNTQGNEGWHTGYNYLTTDTSQIQDAFIADPGGAITTTASATNLSNGTNRPEGGAVLNSSAGNIPGEWLKVELPHKIKLSYAKIVNRTLSNDGQCPKDFKILGSNDDDIWYELIVKQNAGYTAGSTHDEPITNTQNGQNAYKYLAFLCTRINSTSDGALTISEISLYGHKENDTTRFPVSSTVLKYPHVAMTGQPGTSQSVSDLQHAQRGYEVTASSMYVDNASNPYQPWRAFNGGTNGTWFSRGLSSLYGGTDNAYGSVANANLGTDSGGSATHRGEWLKLKLPRKLVLNRIVMYTSGSEAPEDFTLYGSNDGSSWTEILAETGLAATSNGATYTPSSTPSAYKYFGLVIARTVSRHNYTGIRELELYGTEEDLDVVARVGEGLDGKVANFRVYDKYLHEEQALELWDAQKDQFGRAESSVVVHKGRLGVGTTEPEGRFAVLDEAEEMGEFPPKPLVGYKTHIEGHGEYCVNQSTWWGTGGGSTTLPMSGSGFDSGHLPGYGYNAFNKRSDRGWITASSVYTNATGFADSDSKGRFGVLGEWLEIKMPSKIKLKHFTLSLNHDNQDSVGYNTSRFPKQFTLYKSNDGVTWTSTDYTSPNENGPGGGPVLGDYGREITYNANETKSFMYYVILVKQTWSASYSTDPSSHTAIGEWRLFGTRERGQSTLHDGQLTLTKNLTVPRIGPPLDADDTPRRDRLVVEYNTSTNPTANGTVKDTSGRGVDGLMYNDASYDATEKALVFDGTDDYVSMSDWKYNTGFIHSFSGWIKFKSPEESWNVVYGVGDAAGSSRTNFTIWSKTDNSYFRTEADGSGSFIDHTFEFTGNMDKWLHMAVVKSSARIDSTRIYINGVLLPQTNATLADRDIALPNTPQNFNLSSYGPSAGSTGNVNLSNVKFYDTALTTEEVKTLYDMGRCDEGHHVVNFSKTRVGIGLGDGEAPRAALDVRGDIYGGCPVFFHATRTTHAESTSSTGFDPLIWQTTRNNKGGGYSTTTGKFTAPIAGYYEFTYGGMSLTASDTFELVPRLNGTDYKGPVVYASPQSGAHRNAVMTAIVEMKVGDTWHLRMPAGNQSMYGVGNYYNMFTGKFLSY